MYLETAEEVRTGFEDIIRSGKAYLDDADIRGCVVSPMARDGVEVIIGTKIDDQFGPVIMFGIGGIYTELFRETSFRLAPFDRAEAVKMVRKTRAAALIDGFRGNAPLAGDILYDALVRVSTLLSEREDIRELDINPFILGEKTGTALDALITLF